MKKLLIMLTALLCISCGDLQTTEESLDATGVSTLVAAPAFTYTDCAAEWAACKFTGVQTVRFGASVKGVDHFITKSFTAQNLYPGTGILCRNDVFGTDPFPTAVKSCAIQNAVVVPPPVVVPPTSVTTYTQCGSAYNWCTFGPKAIAANVRFGSDKGGWTPVKAQPVGYGTQCNWNAFAAKDPCPVCSEVCQIVTTTLVDAGTPPAVDASVPPVKDASVPPVVDAGKPPVVVDAGGPPVVVDAGGPVVVPPSGQRPSYNKGVGFYVLNGKLYDANDKEFVIRGVNKVHWDNGSEALLKSNPNATRWTMDFNQPPANNIKILLNSAGRAGTVMTKNVVIPGNWNGTCNNDPKTLSSIVDTWVSQASSWNQLEKFSIINIANEWGPTGISMENDSTNGKPVFTWRDSYITAVARMRAAGYHATLQITSGGCGQDPTDLARDALAVFNSDPEKNIIFDQHVYGYYRDPASGAKGGWSNMPTLPDHFAALKATGLVIVIGEFGPGHNIGPSPTDVEPGRIMSLAAQFGFGWLAWAADDGDSSNCADNSWFCMYHNTGVYNSSNDLTVFGRVVVEDPTQGLKAVAVPATVF